MINFPSELNLKVHSHGFLRDQDRDWDLDQENWVVLEPFTLQLNRDREEWVIYPFFRS